MHVMIIWAAGMIGGKLARALAETGRLGETPVTALTLVDVVPPAAPEGVAASCLTADLSDPGCATRLIADRPDIIYHLAAIVSVEAEADFDKGYRINLDGTRYLFDALRLEHLASGY